jgi:hypothetical protein
VESKRGTIHSVKYRKTALAILAALCASIALADDFKTIDGKEYKNVKVSRVEPDGIVLMTKSGISKIYFTELPKDVQERFGYDAEKAATHSAERRANAEALSKQQAEAQQKQAEERARYWSEHQTPASSATPARRTESPELASIRAEAEIRNAEMRGDHLGADFARIKAYYEPRIRAARQAGDTKLANELAKLEEKEIYQATGREVVGNHR